LKGLTPVTPANLEVDAGDWSAAESFDTPAVAAIPAIAGRAAARGRFPALTPFPRRETSSEPSMAVGALGRPPGAPPGPPGSARWLPGTA